MPAIIANKDIFIQNPAYRLELQQWELVEDCTKGQAQVKRRRELYLPKPNPTDESVENAQRYEQYLARAIFYNTLFRTLSGFVGVAFRKPPQEEIPAAIEYITDNADGSGVSLNQQAQWTLSEVLKKGRAGLLVDYPRTEGGTTRADVARGIRATIQTYTAESVIDWNEEETETGCRLNYVKIAEIDESVDVETGARETKTAFTMLRLIDGVYSIERTSETGAVMGERVEPRQANGQTFDFIPFVFCGSEDNTPDIDQAILYDLAAINIGHYRNSADNEESSYIAGQPTLAVTSSISAAEFQEHNPNGVLIGARRGHFLGESGALTMVQADPNSLPRELMKDKEAQMVALGAQLISSDTGDTAFATGVKLATNTSALALVVGNVSDAYVQCLNWAMLFMSGEPTSEITYAINRDFFPPDMDPQTITAWVSGIQGGILPQTAFNDLLRSADLTALTDDEIRAEVENSAAGVGGIDLGGS